MDYCFFGVGVTFISANTVLPGFLTALGASSAFIGLVSSLQSASWLLPQLFAARYVASQSRKKPYILWPAAIGRSLLLVLAVLIWAMGNRSPSLVAIIVAVVTIGFWMGDGLASVPWFDMLSNMIPPRRRGRLTGTGQVLSGVLAFAAGLLVEYLLSDRGPAFPNNYATLYGLGFVMLVHSFVATASAVEIPGTPKEKTPTWREYVPQLWRVFKQDRVFRRFILARQLSGLGMLSIPFYMPYALERLHLPAHVAGRYTSIGVVGSILAAVLFGWLNEHLGSKWVILTGLTLGVLIPSSALLLPPILTDPTWLAWGYGLVFFFLSAMMGSMMPGWMTYMLEWAPEKDRPTYVGLTNTLNGITPLFSTLGGLILQWSGKNYRLLFAVTLVGLVLTWPLSLHLPEPRHKEQRASSTLQ